MGKRVPDEAVFEAIQRWRGRVNAAADEVGMRRGNFYERLDGIGIGQAELDAIRAGAVFELGPGGHVKKTEHVPLVPHEATAPDVRLSSRVPVKVGGDVRSFVGVTTTFPIQPRPEKREAPRLTPEQERKLDRCRQRLMKKYGYDPGRSKILQQLVDDELETWFDRLIGEYPPPPARPAEDPEGGE